MRVAEENEFSSPPVRTRLTPHPRFANLRP